MSSQRGNAKKKKPPKHQNKIGFKNNKHDTSKLTKALNSMTIGGVCSRCKETIEWKIKYKKYKPLTQAKKCTKCSQKTVKYAYHIMCAVCAQDAGVCAKCGTKGDDVQPYAPTPSEQAAEESKLEAELKMLSERKRRAFFRYQDKGFTDEDAQAMSEKEAANYEDKEEEEEEEEGDDGTSGSDDKDGSSEKLRESVEEQTSQDNCDDNDQLLDCAGRSTLDVQNEMSEQCKDTVIDDDNRQYTVS